MDDVEALPRLRDAMLAVTSAAELAAVLQQVVEAAVALAGARAAELEVDAGSGVRASAGADGDRPDVGGALTVPVSAGGSVRGTLTVLAGDVPAGFTARDEDFVAVLGAVAGVAVERARLLDRVRERERWLAAIREINVALLEGQGFEEVMRSTTRHTRALVNADLVTVAIPSGPETLVLRAADGEHADAMEGIEFPRGSSISGEVIRTGRPVVAEDVGQDPRTAQPVVRLGVFGPALLVPLAARGEPFGTLLVANLRGGRLFDDGDVTVATTIASHASLAVDYAASQERLRHVDLLEERERIAREMHEAVVQRVFDTGLSIEHVAMRLGGDFPDIVHTLTNAVDQLDRVIREVRTAIFAPPEAGTR